MGLTTIVMIMVIVWAISKIGEDLGIADRIRKGKRSSNDDDDED